ncbi:LSM12 homolog A [Drosophila novamexicana]|uniref:LSM12 homolog A n=1 Tax=Drosophila novamexicana TaxID=47314 RepID=UPI0011E5D9F1|nr:LSM12 homolog A [Drosophila novamexicana]
MSFNPFPIGTQLHVETCFGDHITGEVVTYEHSVKMLILSCPGKDSKGKKCLNQSIVNLDFCKNLKIIREAKTPDTSLNEPPARLNLLRLDQRLQQSVEQRENLLRSRNEHATPRGRQMFTMLTKHFGSSELTWQVDSILVLQQVTIAPPYRTSDITAKQNLPKLVGYVQRLVEKFNAQNGNGDADVEMAAK